jgi:hypothetical protein
LAEKRLQNRRIIMVTILRAFYFMTDFPFHEKRDFVLSLFHGGLLCPLKQEHG